MHQKKHAEVVKRLKRADGHLRTIINMIEEEQPCLQLAQQLQAVENAIVNAKKALIHGHITQCIQECLRSPGSRGIAALKEFEAIARYL
jgi:uncharacterized protein